MDQRKRSCECCQIAKEFPGYRLFCPSCLHCGARLIQTIQRKAIPMQDKVRRCRAVLADWMAMGHDETSLRDLAKGSETPIGPACGTESDHQGRTKRR